jgi:toxin ParE1/3/4
MRIEWTKLANADLKHIHAYIRQDSPKAAIAVLASIRRALRGQLATSPLSGRIGRVDGTRELVVPRLPYIVAYRVTGTGVQILRVLHGAQRWPQGF